MEEPAVPILRVRDLHTHFFTDDGVVKAVDGISFHLHPGRTLALVGESGCGKSVTAGSLLRLTQAPGRIVQGSIEVALEPGNTVDVAALREGDDLLYHIRGGVVSMIFQEPMTALSPVHTIGNQMCEAILLHQRMSYKAAEDIAVDMLTRVGIPGARARLAQYPFEFSGGMRQRVCIAMALACRPKVLIADEPTTALDVTIQAQILQLIASLQQELGTAVLLITHDLGVVAQVADEVAVMYLGRIVEQGSVRQVLKTPAHPYTQGLLRSLPSLNHGSRLDAIPGSISAPSRRPGGCPFHPRCRFHEAGICDQEPHPPLRDLGEGRHSACLRHDALPLFRLSDMDANGDRA